MFDRALLKCCSRNVCTLRLLSISYGTSPSRPLLSTFIYRDHYLSNKWSKPTSSYDTLATSRRKNLLWVNIWFKCDKVCETLNSLCTRFSFEINLTEECSDERLIFKHTLTEPAKVFRAKSNSHPHPLSRSCVLLVNRFWKLKECSSTIVDAVCFKTIVKWNNPFWIQ